MSQKLAYGVGGGIYTSNPQDLSLISSQALYAKSLTTTVENSTLSTFFSSVAQRGAESAITVADTYITLCDITGSGLLCNVVYPTHSAAFAATLKITVDGVVHTLNVPSVTALYRVLLGGYTPANSISLASDYTGANSKGDIGFVNARVGGIPRIPAGDGSGNTLLTPERAKAEGYPMLRFNTSLKVEVKASLLSATAVHKQCVVTYQLDV